MLSNIYFFLEDLIIKSHPEIPWTKIGIKELLNWPHISVEFKSPELSFKRKNCGEYFRFVNLNNSYIPIPKDSDFIEQIDIVDQSNVRTCYSVNLLKAYANEYVNLLKNAQGVSIVKFTFFNNTLYSSIFENC